MQTEEQGSLPTTDLKKKPVRYATVYGVPQDIFFLRHAVKIIVDSVFFVDVSMEPERAYA